MNPPVSPTPNISMDKPQRRVWWWVVLTVVIVHLLLFLASATILMVFMNRSGSKFASLVMAEHRTYLIWTNLGLLRGYAFVAAGYALLVFPVVRWWLGGCNVVDSRWAVVWRTLAVSAALMAWFSIKLSYFRPYFLPAGKSDSGFASFLDKFPESVRPALDFTVFEFLPAAAVFGAAVFYGACLLRRVFRGGVRRRRAAALSFSVCVVLAVCAIPAQLITQNGSLRKPGRADGPLNLLILASDSLRADHLSCNGYPRPTSPNIDSIAAESVNFTKMMTPIASTLESMTTIMTGQYPHTHGIRNMYPSKDDVTRTRRDAPQLAEILEKRGYRTSVLGDWCACTFNFMPLGFEHMEISEFDDFRLYVAQAVYMAHFIMPLYFDNKIGYRIFPRLKSFATYVTPKTVTGNLAAHLQREGAGQQPFFITAFYSCTHFPYYCPPPYHGLFTDPSYQGRSRFKVDFDLESFVRGTDIDEQFKKLPPGEIRQIRDLYDGSIRFFDDQVGAAMAALRQNGLLENTIVIVMSDHGDDLFEPNTTFGHGLSFNGGDQTNHLPCIFHVPGNRFASAKVERLTRTLDLAPTVLDILGLPPEPRFEGRSLVPYLEGSSEDLSLAFYGETSFLFFNRKVAGEEPQGMPPFEETVRIDPTFDYHFVVRDEFKDAVLRTKERCLRTEHWKLIFTPGVRDDIWQLFDLRRDPHCEKDVKSSNGEVLNVMRKALMIWMLQHRETAINGIFPNGEPEAR